MTELYLSQPKNLASSRGIMESYVDSTKCQICQFHKKQTNFFFSACQHNGICIKCGERRMLSCIDQKKYPTCYMADCDAKMITGQKSLFQYSSKSSLTKWEQFLENQLRPKSLNLPACMVIDCKGVIEKNRCLKCNQQYCENCKQFSHSFRIKCPKKKQIQVDGLKECPKCKQKYVRVSGCQHIICPTCRYQFCEVCKGQWSPFHHACMDSIYSQNNNIKISKKQANNCCALF